MKYITVLLLLLSLSTNVYALDFSLLLEKAKEKVALLLGAEVREVRAIIPMPKIPEVKEDAMSTDVYIKKGEIYKQGASFNKLTLEQKRKYRIAFLEELYEATRNVDAKRGEVLRFLNILEQGGTREGIYRSLVLDNVYLTLEGYDEPSTDEVIFFTMNYGQKFLALNFPKESISKLNIWSIKRVLTEKTLEVLDAFKNADEIHRWYANFSLYLQKEKSGIWKSKARKSTNIKFYYEWSKSVPFQHIKSEVVIKLHKLMNELK